MQILEGNNMLLNEQWIIKEIKGETKNGVKQMQVSMQHIKIYGTQSSSFESMLMAIG